MNGHEITIDFLQDVLGVTDTELQRGVSQIALFGKTEDGEDVTVQIRLMHPVVSLKSRIASILSPATLRRDAIAFAQLNAVEIVVRCFIDEAFDYSLFVPAM